MNKLHFNSNKDTITHAKVSRNPRMQDGVLVWDNYFTAVEIENTTVTFLEYQNDLGVSIDIADAISFDHNNRIYHYNLMNIQFYKLVVA
jgi:hypothetical protein